MSTAGVAFREFTMPTRPIGRAIVGERLDPLIEAIRACIRRIRLDREMGSHVFADQEGWVYVVAEQSASATTLLRECSALHVGLYAHQFQRVAWPTPHELFIDLVSHFFNLGFLTPAMFYGEERRDR